MHRLSICRTYGAETAHDPFPTAAPWATIYRPSGAESRADFGELSSSLSLRAEGSRAGRLCFARVSLLLLPLLEHLARPHLLEALQVRPERARAGEDHPQVLRLEVLGEDVE